MTPEEFLASLLLALLIAVTGSLIVLAMPDKQNEHPAAVRKAFAECRAFAKSNPNLTSEEEYAVFKYCMNAKGFSL